ncbi:MAG: PEP-CTERM sorting domain-containing protein [Rubripirellula sp.]|nr:PEP-CTERM sorting domain-containing protein [Rubripirellula sp.]
MVRAIQLAVACVAVLVASAGQVQAGIIFSSIGGSPESGQNYTYGFDFTPVQDITVDSLGFYDFGQDGLNASHRVGIWTTSGVLLTSTTVTTANSTLSGPVFNGGQFRFTPIAGLDLDVGTTYRFGAAIEGAYDTWFFGGTNISESPSLALVSTSGFYASGDFVFPSSTVGNTYAVGSFTAVPTTAAVPEPSSLALFGIGACVAGLGAARRRRRENRQQATV